MLIISKLSGFSCTAATTTLQCVASVNFDLTALLFVPSNSTLSLKLPSSDKHETFTPVVCTSHRDYKQTVLHMQIAILKVHESKQPKNKTLTNRNSFPAFNSSAIFQLGLAFGQPLLS